MYVYIYIYIYIYIMYLFTNAGSKTTASTVKYRKRTIQCIDVIIVQ